MAKVFISYNREDSDFAELVEGRLIKAGHDTSMDLEIINAGEDWRDRIDQSIRESNVLVVIITPDSMASEYVTYEWAFALGAGVKVVPLELKATNLHPRLEILQYLDFTEKKRPWEMLLLEVQKAAENQQVTTVSVSPDAPPTIKHAVAALDSLDPDEQIAGIKLLGNTDHPAAYDALVGALKHPVKNVRLAAALVFPDRKDSRILNGLLDAYQDREFLRHYWPGKDKLNISAWIASMGPPAIPCLIEALQNPHLGIRCDAIDALGLIGDVAAVPELIHALKDKSKIIRSSAAIALGKIGDKRAIPELHPVLEDQYFEVRAAAAKALGELKDNTSVSVLLDHLREDKSDVRAAAALALGQIGDPMAFPELINSLQNPDENYYVRKAAAEALGLIGDVGAIESLRNLLHSAFDQSEATGYLMYLGYEAAKALIRLRDFDSFPFIAEAVNMFRSGIAPTDVIDTFKTLGEKAIPALITILNGHSHLQEDAARALKLIATPEAIAAVKKWERKN